MREKYQCRIHNNGRMFVGTRLKRVPTLNGIKDERVYFGSGREAGNWRP